MAEKLKMHSADIIGENISFIESRFPNVIVEAYDDNGKLTKKVDFEILKQELSHILITDNQQRYQMIWPDKNKSILLSNSPVNCTLRPCEKESVRFDATENLYIEGDNLDVLKILRETYLNKIKMIYIDPPYNTGNDFVYEDDFSENANDYLTRSGQYSESGERLVKNLDSNGRYHTNWLNMIYPRIKISKDLLSENGVIFVSIDEHEYLNMGKMLDEIFGPQNYIATLIRKTKSMTADAETGINLQHEYCFLYSKNKKNIKLHGDLKDFANYSNPDNDPRGDWCSADPSAKSGGPSTSFEIRNPITGQVDLPPTGRYWAFSKTTLEKYIEEGKIKFKSKIKNNERGFVFKRYKNEINDIYNPLNSLMIDNKFMNQTATQEVNLILEDDCFSYPKPVSFIKQLIYSCTENDDIILDYFSGSATTAQAVFELNMEQSSDRKFIMIQLPENLDENLKNAKDSEKKQILNCIKICDELNKEHVLTVIAEERLKRVINKMTEEIGIFNSGVDLGFRVLKLDSSNMKDVYYNPKNLIHSLLEEDVDNVKGDRTPLDLLFQVMLELGVDLSAKIEKKIIGESTLYIVNESYLVACFDKNIDDNVVKTAANIKPIYIVFRDASFNSDSSNINCEQIIKTISPSTGLKVI